MNISKVHRSILRWGIVIVLGITLVVFLPVIFNQWVNWDDYAYIHNNKLIHHLTWANLVAIFGTNQLVGSYTPLTLLTYALEYQISGTNPLLYHLNSLLMHGFNVVLVYHLALALKQDRMVSLIIAFFFAIHPMHVEPVAWVSGRKELLYTCFFLISMLAYINYSTRKLGGRFYIVSLLSFICALLSKSSAITLPMILLLLDYWQGRKEVQRVIIEKFPFFILAIVVSFLAVSGQQEGTAMHSIQAYPFHKTVFIGGYNVLIYTVKAVLPYQLSAFHPYPFTDVSLMPAYIYIGPFVLVALLIVGYRKSKGKPDYILGILFFIITLFPVIKILPFGRGIMAERYTYLPYVGLLIAISSFFSNQARNTTEVTSFFKLVLTAVALIFATVSYSRTSVWSNGESLWKDVISKYPGHYLGYVNLAEYYESRKLVDKSLLYYDLAISVDSTHQDLYMERGRQLQTMGRFEAAYNDFTTSIQLHPTAKAYINRSLIHLRQLNDPKAAIQDLNKALSVDPYSQTAYINKGVIFETQMQYDSAMATYSRGIEMSGDATLYRFRGVIYMSQLRWEEAIADLTLAIQKNPLYDEAYFLRSKSYFAQQEYEGARKDVRYALQLGYKVDAEYLSSLDIDHE